jgi:calcineurin-like phosphoesterase family protein
MNPLRILSVAATFGLAVACTVPAQTVARSPNLRSVLPIDPPKRPLPPEALSADSTRFSFVFYGGMRGREDGMEVAFEHMLVAQAIIDTVASRRDSPDPIRFILSNGDAVVDGRYARQWNVSWAPIIEHLTAETGLPYFLSAGNHDVTESMDINNAGRRDGLNNLLNAVGRLIPPNGDKHRLAGYPTYVFGYGKVFVIAFDSDIGDDRKQYEWVKAQLDGLDSNRYTTVVAVCHHPPFSSGPHGFRGLEPQILSMRNRWMPLFRKYHVRLLLTGHDHFYEHWVEHYRDTTGWHRIDEIVSGGGGAPLYPYVGEPATNGYLSAGSRDSVRLNHLVRPGPEPADNPYHFTVIHVDGDELSLEVIGVAGGESFRPYGTPRVSLADPSK